jgi:hypothetical protein
MPNGLLILSAFLLYGLFVYGPELARIIGRKRKIIGKPYKVVKHEGSIITLDRPFDSDTLREVNARRGYK